MLTSKLFDISDIFVVPSLSVLVDEIHHDLDSYRHRLINTVENDLLKPNLVEAAR